MSGTKWKMNEELSGVKKGELQLREAGKKGEMVGEDMFVKPIAALSNWFILLQVQLIQSCQLDKHMNRQYKKKKKGKDKLKKRGHFFAK